MHMNVFLKVLYHDPYEEDHDRVMQNSLTTHTLERPMVLPFWFKESGFFFVIATHWRTAVRIMATQETINATMLSVLPLSLSSSSSSALFFVLPADFSAA